MVKDPELPPPTMGVREVGLTGFPPLIKLGRFVIVGELIGERPVDTGDPIVGAARTVLVATMGVGAVTVTTGTPTGWDPWMGVGVGTDLAKWATGEAGVALAEDEGEDDDGVDDEAPVALNIAPCSISM